MFSIRTDVADLKLEIYTALGRLVANETISGAVKLFLD
jgi:hypothetical protein